MPNEVWLMSTGPATIAVPATFNAYLAATDVAEILESALPASPRAQLSGGPATLGFGLVNALMKQGGDVHAGRAEVLVNGTDYSGALNGAVRLTLDEDLKYPKATLTFNSSLFHNLIHLDAEPGVPVVITWVQRDADTGTVYRIPVLTGELQDVQPNDDITHTTTAVIEGRAGRLDRVQVDGSFRMDGLPWGCVIAGSIAAPAGAAGELEITSNGNNTDFSNADGTAALDDTTVGNPPNMNSGGGGPGGGIGGNGGPNQGGGILYKNFAAGTLDLTAQANLTLNSNDALGTKHVFITSSGEGADLVASDDGPPPGAVPLATFEYRRVGQDIMPGDITDVRNRFFRVEDRQISKFLTYLIASVGGFTAPSSYPTVNDDFLTSNIQLSGSLSQIITDIARLARWKWRYDGEANLVFWHDRIDRNGFPRWTYKRNNYKACTFSSPQLQDIPGGGVVIEGYHTENQGRNLTKETLVLETFQKKPESQESAGFGLAGGHQRYAQRIQDKLQLATRIERTTFYLGGTEVLRIDDKYVRRNKRGSVSAARRGGGAQGAGAGSSKYTPEAGSDYQFSEETMMFYERVRVEQFVQSGVMRGFVKSIERQNDPVTFTAGGVGYDAILGYGVRAYGWRYDEERFELMSIEQIDIDPTGFGFILSKHSQHWANGNPNVNWEGPQQGSGHGGVSPAGTGSLHNPEEEMILVMEETTDFTRENFEWYQIDRDKRGFVKHPGASAHQGVSVGGGLKPLGHASSEISSQEVEHQRLRGQPPSVEGIEDDISVKKVGAEMIGPTVTADYGSENQDFPSYPHVQSFEQSDRLAHWRWANLLAYDAVLDASFNAGMNLGDDVNIEKNLTDGRLYDVTGKVRKVEASLPHKDGQPSTMKATLKVDYYEMKPLQDARV